MSSKRIFTIGYTRTVLSIHGSIVSSAYGLYEGDSEASYHFELGFGKLQKYSEETYWAAVHDFLERTIASLMNCYPEPCFPDHVLAFGEAAQFPRFSKILLDIVKEMFQHKDHPPILNDDAEFVLARGSAEFAKRSYFS